MPRPCSITESPADIEITNICNGNTAIIEYNEEFKLFGVWVQLQGNMKTQYDAMETKINDLT